MGRARTRRRSARRPGGRDVDSAAKPPNGYHPAWGSRRAIVVFGLVAALCVAVDLWSKWYAFEALSGRGGRVTVIQGLLRLTLSTNRGIVFGLEVPRWLVQVATLAAMAAVAVLFAGSDRRYWGLHAALAMVLGGAAGNLYDRLFARVTLPGQGTVTGQVRDFIDVTIPVVRYPWPVFNVADVLLVVGLGLILLHMLRHRERRGG